MVLGNFSAVSSILATLTISQREKDYLALVAKLLSESYGKIRLANLPPGKSARSGQKEAQRRYRKSKVNVTGWPAIKLGDGLNFDN